MILGPDLEKALNEPYDFTYYGVTNFGTLLEQGVFVSKHKSVQTHSLKKIDLEYKELATPRTYYELARRDGVSYLVPKVIFDHVDLPETRTTVFC